jgi:hypothetical protein
MRLAIALALLIIPSLLVVAGEEPAEKPAQEAPAKEETAKPVDPVHHALVQKKVGFCAVYLPPECADEANAEQTWPVCLILHGHGSTETGHGGLSNTSHAGKTIRNLDDLRAAIGAAGEGTESVVVEWRRGEESMKATIRPGQIGVMLADR